MKTQITKPGGYLYLLQREGKTNFGNAFSKTKQNLVRYWQIKDSKYTGNAMVIYKGKAGLRTRTELANYLKQIKAM
jgi:hypothetical protein